MKYLELVLLYCLLIVTSCNRFPKDAANTLEKVRNNQLLVGVPLNEKEGGSKDRPAEKLLRAYADHLHAKIVWVPGLQSELAELLKSREIQLAAADFDKSSLFKKEIAFTKPFREEIVKIGAPGGTPIPGDIAGKKVYVTDRLTASWVKKKDGIPVLADTGNIPQGLFAGTEEMLQQKDFQVSGITLHKTKYVIALPKGENAFLMDLEKFIDEYGK